MFAEHAAAALTALAASHKATPAAVDAIVDAILSRQRVVLAGAGKSYLVGQLAARIAVSYGLHWTALDTASAGHGDAGMLHPSDLLLLISKSGETRETLSLARWVDEMTIISLCMRENSSLSVLADCTLVLPLAGEHSLYGHAPMASSIVFLAVLFELINRVASERCSEEKYLESHPAGEIGASIRG